jgi:hypothetical protein
VRKLGWILIGCAAAAWAGCADGSSLQEGFNQQEGSGASGGDGGAGGAPGATSSGNGGSVGSGGSGAEGGGGGGQGGGGEICDYTAPAPCASAEELPGIDGDTGNDVESATGNTSRWFHIYVAEAVSSVVDYPPLSYTATLSSPPGMNYDLYVYTGDTGGPDCQAQPVKGSGTPEQVSDQWGDSIGSEDGTWITLEVRYVSGDACGPQDSWTLTIAGHTQ